MFNSAMLVKLSNSLQKTRKRTKIKRGYDKEGEDSRAINGEREGKEQREYNIK